MTSDKLRRICKYFCISGGNLFFAAAVAAAAASVPAPAEREETKKKIKQKKYVNGHSFF